MKKYFTVFIIVFVINMYSQNSKKKELDSLIGLLKTEKTDTSKILVYNELSRFYLYQDSKIGLQYAKKSYLLSKKNKWDKGIGISYKNFGMHQISLGNYKLASNYFIISKEKLKKVKDKLELASLYNQMGILAANKGDFLTSISFFFKSLQIYESQKIKRQKLLAALYENIGTVYNFTNEYNKAILYYKKAIVAYSKCKFKETETAMVISNLGSVYQKNNNPKQALIEFEKANKILEINGSNFALGLNYSLIGSTLLDLKNYEKSIQQLLIAVNFVKKTNDKELLATTLQNLGSSYLKKGCAENNFTEIEAAFSYLKKSEIIHQQLNNQEGLIKDYLYLSNYYEVKRELDKSLQYYKKYTVSKDFVFNKKNEQTIESLENKREITLRDKQLSINKILLEAKEKQKWFFIVGLLSLGIIGSLLFYQGRNRQKTNKKLQVLNTELDEANKAKTRFFSILNHDLRGPVANLVFFLQLQKESPEMLDEESTKRMQDKTISGAENLLTSMEDILQWSKSQMENFKPQPKNVSINTLFEDTKNHFLSEEKVQISFDNPNNILITTDENYLKTIIRNLTGNAIKALIDIENPIINWKAWQENGQSYLSISDNGKGGSDEQFKALYDDKEVVGIKSGLGLHLIRDLAKAINCEISVDSVVNVGTTFILKL